MAPAPKMSNAELIAALQTIAIEGDPNGYVVEALIRLLNLIKPDPSQQ